MSILTQSFSHSVSSLMIGKIQGNIVDMLYAPLSALEVSMAIILAALTRSFLIAIILILMCCFSMDKFINILFLKTIKLNLVAKNYQFDNLNSTKK